MPTLHLGDDAMNDAIAELRQASQALGDFLQKRIAVLHRQRRGGGKHDV
jgi:hypothetical protein